MTELEHALIRQGHTHKEALEIMKEMVEDVLDGCDPEDLLFNYGLEPDYVFDILDFALENQ